MFFSLQGLDKKTWGSGLNLRGNEGLLFDEMVRVVFVGNLMKGSSFGFNRYVFHDFQAGASVRSI